MRLVILIFSLILFVAKSHAQNEKDLVDEKIIHLKKELLELDLLKNYPEKKSTTTEAEAESFNSASRSYIETLVNKYPNISPKEKEDLEFLKFQLEKIHDLESKNLAEDPKQNNNAISIDSAAYVKLLTRETADVYFKIQILATETSSSDAKISKALDLNEEIYEEFDNGLYKYVVGKFSNYNSAKLKSNEINLLKGIDSFVVGYKNDKRTPFEDIFGF